MSQSADQSIISRLAPVYQPSPLMSRRNMDSRTRATSPRTSFSNLRKFNSAAKLNEENVTPPGSPPSLEGQDPATKPEKMSFIDWWLEQA